MISTTKKWIERCIFIAASTLLISICSPSLATPTVDKQVISWTEPGWFQVLSLPDFISVCEGGTSCSVEPGDYLVVNHTSKQRWDLVNVPSEEETTHTSETQHSPAQATISVSGNLIQWPNDGWYQVQSALDYSNICEGGTTCLVEDGDYIVINHTTDKRYTISVASTTEISNGFENSPIVDDELPPTSEIIIRDGSISWTIDGWYQVQSRDDFRTICEGTEYCDAPPGEYIVINHTTDQRWDNVIIPATATSQPEPEIEIVETPTQPNLEPSQSTGLLQPTNFRFTRYSANSIELFWNYDWQTVNTIDNYEVLIDGKVEYVGGGKSYFVNNLPDSDSYDVEVRAVKAGLRGPGSKLVIPAGTNTIAARIDAFLTEINKIGIAPINRINEKIAGGENLSDEEQNCLPKYASNFTSRINSIDCDENHLVVFDSPIRVHNASFSGNRITNVFIELPVVWSVPESNGNTYSYRRPSPTAGVDIQLNLQLDSILRYSFQRDYNCEVNLISKQLVISNTTSSLDTCVRRMDSVTHSLKTYRIINENGGVVPVLESYEDCTFFENTDYCHAIYSGSNNSKLEARRNGAVRWSLWLRQSDTFRSLAVDQEKIVLLVTRVNNDGRQMLVASVFNQIGQWLYDVPIETPNYTSTIGLSTNDSEQRLNSYLEDQILYFTNHWSVLMPPCNSVCFPGMLSFTHTQAGVSLIKIDLSTGVVLDFKHGNPNERLRSFYVDTGYVNQELQNWMDPEPYLLRLAR